MTTLHTRITREFRRRGPAVRQLYVNARRAARFFKDAPRRSAFSRLPATGLVLPADAGFLVVPPGQFEETPAVVSDAHAALQRFDASAPPKLTP